MCAYLFSKNHEFDWISFSTRDLCFQNLNNWFSHVLVHSLEYLNIKSFYRIDEKLVTLTTKYQNRNGLHYKNNIQKVNELEWIPVKKLILVYISSRFRFRYPDYRFKVLKFSIISFGYLGVLSKRDKPWFNPALISIHMRHSG